MIIFEKSDDALTCMRYRVGAEYTCVKYHNPKSYLNPTITPTYGDTSTILVNDGFV